MKRTNEQNKRLHWLITATNNIENKADLVSMYTAGRTRTSAEMSEDEAALLIEALEVQAKSLNKQRKRIFSQIRKIRLLHHDDKLSEGEVLQYIRSIVGLKVKSVDRLNEYTKQELNLILLRLDMIAKKTPENYRKKLKKWT
jgi:hypothetical protein